MSARGSYGDAFGRRFGVDSAASFVSQTLAKTEVAVTFLNQPTPTFDYSEPQPAADAYLVSLGFQDFPGYQVWENGKPVKSSPVQAPQVTIYDLRARPYIFVNNPMIGLHFHLPRAAFDALADNSGVQRSGDLAYPHGAGIDDAVVHHLALSLMPAFRNPAEANRLFVDHVTLAISTHVAHIYGGLRSSGPKRGGLALWQEKLALEVLDANLAGEISHAAIAAQCGLSASHFARAFRISTGLAPHRWLLKRRIDKAKEMLRDTATPLSLIAQDCGFADQSHFTRVFTRLTGIAPGE